MRPLSRVLVDSSIWIDFYRPSGSDEVRDQVREALVRDGVATVPLIVAEVVRGAPNETELEGLVQDLSALHVLDVDFETGAYAARLGFALRREGRTVPTTDLLIAAAAVRSGCELWHRDAHFETIGKTCPLEERRF